MTLTNEQLEAEVKRIAELDQKRTQGEIHILGNMILFGEKTVAQCSSYNDTPYLEWLNGDAESNFIEASTQMAQIIRQLSEELQNSIPIAKLDGMVEVAVKGYLEREDKGYARDTIYDYIKAVINAIKQEAGK